MDRKQEDEFVEQREAAFRGLRQKSCRHSRNQQYELHDWGRTATKAAIGYVRFRSKAKHFGPVKPHHCFSKMPYQV